jgi:hypothetical protein
MTADIISLAAIQRARNVLAAGEWDVIVAAMRKMSPAAVEALIDCLDEQQLLGLKRAVIATVKADQQPPDDGPAAA